MALASWVGGRFTEATWYRPPAAAGLALGAAAFAAMAATWGPEASIPLMVVCLAFLGAGFGLVTAPANAAAVDAVPEDRRGVASGLVILSRLMGLAVGLSGLTAWAMYRFDTARRALVLPPLEDPGYEDALRRAQETLTSSALRETFYFAAGLLLLALAATLLLRRRRPAPRSAETAAPGIPPP
jgi:MFS family permease